MDYEYNNAEDCVEEYEDFPSYKPQTRSVKKAKKNYFRIWLYIQAYGGLVSERLCI